ncbi:MAG: hypothetical protein ABEH56_05505 [Salinirussus sp.]
MALRTLLVVSVVALALVGGAVVLVQGGVDLPGSPGADGPSGGGSESGPETGTGAESSATATPGASTRTEAGTDTGDVAQNPWRRPNVTVGVAANASAAFGVAVRRAVDYWNGNGSEFAAYPVDLRYTNGSEADILVRPVGYPLECGRLEGDAIGCAPVFDAEDRPSNPTVVRIVRGIPGPSARETAKHELGHVLGLRHGDEPSGLMSHGPQLTARQDRVVRSIDPRGMEREIEAQLNAAREDAGLEPLAGDRALRERARQRAAEIAAGGVRGGGTIQLGMRLDCQIDLEGNRYLDGGDGDIYLGGFFTYRNPAGSTTANYTETEYIGGRDSVIADVVEKWSVRQGNEYAPHYERHGVGVEVSGNGTVVAVRAIC